MQQAEIKSKKFSRWLLASRPKTLPAAFAPVFVGSALAFNSGVFKFVNALIALICSVLIQVGTNFVNDLYDFLTGNDSPNRVGPTRALSSGLISIREMKLAIIITFGLTFVLGLYLVYQSDYWILLIGILSIISGIAYTAGPFPLAYNALGDLFVFIFFGFVGTIGTYYVQAVKIIELSIWASVPVGALITNILVVNNLRDIDEDKSNNKITLAVIIGRQFTKFQYVLSIVISNLVIVFIYVKFIQNFFVLLPLITIPISISLIKMIFTTTGENLNKTLALTALFSASFSFLFALGIILS
ncbi:MAG: 1,4-dihydroxy-2-naphthoate polyprenyltransferase [Ignavibacteriales bacterium]